VEVKVRNPSVLFGAVNLVELKAVEGAEEYPLIAYNPFGQEQGTEVPTAILLHDASGREIRLGSLFSLDGQLLVEDGWAVSTAKIRLRALKAFSLIFQIPTKTGTFEIQGLGPSIVGAVNF
jgi:hypothetical protein